MDTLLVNILFVAAGALAGAVGGWCIRNTAPSNGALKPSPPALPPDPIDVKLADTKDINHVETLMARLHQLTASVAADVDEHNTQVQAINDELTSGGDVVSIVERLVHMNERMQSQLHAAESRLQQQASEIESHMQEARTDPLTKLGNRRAFDDELEQCVVNFRTRRSPACLMMLDVDHFKKFNDAYGHQAGDEVLKGVARVLRRELMGNEVVCRYGGEEFAIIFPSSELAEILPRAEKARLAVAREVFEFDGLDLRVTASGGVAGLQSGESSEQLIKRADEALYECKRRGRNCGCWHDGQKVHPLHESANRQAGTPASTRSGSEPVDVDRNQSAFNTISEVEEPKFDRRDRIAGLADRETFYKDLERRLAEQQRTGLPTSILLIEMDRFLDTVDEFGGKAAELALRAAAQILKVTMREMDHAARFDDAVFALLLPGACLADAGAVAERMRIAIENCRVPANGEELRFTVSLGVVEAIPGEKHSSVLSRVSQALVSARETGGNCLVAMSQTGENCSMAMSM